jgi:hypothetical protein
MQLPIELSELIISNASNEESNRNPGGIRTVKGKPGHFLIAKMQTRVLLHPQARRFRAWLESFQGNAYVEVELPVASSPLGSALGVPKIKTVDGNDARRVIIDGWELGQIEALSPGDFVRFANHKKVYEVKECGVVAADGSAELILTRPLLRAVIVGELLHVRPSFCLGIEGKVPEIKEGNNAPQSYSFLMGEIWWV